MTTPLYPTFEKRIRDSAEQIVLSQLEPWVFFNAGYPVRLTKANGKEITIQGGGFEGSPRHVFWTRYIDPFLENLAISEIAAATAMAKERQVDATQVLTEVQNLLLAAFNKIFRRMVEMDRRLLGKGFPEKITIRPVEREMSAMRDFVEMHVRAEIDMARTIRQTQQNHKEREQKFGVLCSPRQASIDFEVYRTERMESSAVGVLFVDIDDFKALNTKFTEVVVDENILKPFQQHVASLCLQRGEAYRQGGEEFLVLLPNQTPAEVRAFAERLRSELSAHVFLVRDERIQITVSIGGALLPDDGDTFTDLIAKANSAEHGAKAQGKNRVVMWSPDA